VPEKHASSCLISIYRYGIWYMDQNVGVWRKKMNEESESTTQNMDDVH